LSEYSKSVVGLNQKNVAVALRGSLRLSPTSSIENVTALVDMLVMLDRLDVPSLDPETSLPARAQFNSALLKTLIVLKKNKQTGKTCCLRYRGVAKLFLPEKGGVYFKQSWRKACRHRVRADQVVQHRVASKGIDRVVGRQGSRTSNCRGAQASLSRRCS
jgi:hypothetical protein